MTDYCDCPRCNEFDKLIQEIEGWVAGIGLKLVDNREAENLSPQMRHRLLGRLHTICEKIADINALVMNESLTDGGN